MSLAELLQMPHKLALDRASLLIVDDDITVIHVLIKILSGIGSIRYALNGSDALRLAEQEPPDVVLLDVRMPGMSGFEVLGAMRSQPRLMNMFAIFVTGQSSVEMEEEALAQGAEDFITKPFHPAIVAARVRTQLRLKRALDQLRQLSFTDALTGVIATARCTSTRWAWRPLRSSRHGLAGFIRRMLT